MTPDAPIELRLRAALVETLDQHQGPHPVWLESPAHTRALQDEARRRRWPLRLLAIAALVALGGAAAAAGAILLRTDAPEPDQTSKSNGWFATSVNRAVENGDFNIVFTRPGIPETTVVGRAGDGLDQVCPAFSPDGRYLAYQETPSGSQDGSPWTLVAAELEESGLPGLAAKRFAPGDPQARVGDPPFVGASGWCFRWSSDGSRVAYIARSGLRVIDLDSGSDSLVAGLGRLPDSADRQYEIGQFGWSPDGTRIAYTRDSGESLHTSQLWMVGLDGSQVPVPAAAGTNELISSISWSPEGKSLAIGGDLAVFEHPDQFRGSITTGSSFIRTVDVDADVHAARQVDEWPEDMGSGPLWSPDGTRLAYIRHTELVVATADRPGQAIDVSIPGVDSFATGITDWSASGDRVLVCAADHPYLDRFGQSWSVLVDPTGQAAPERAAGINGCSGSWQVVQK